VIFVDGGYVHLLEGYTFGSRWPQEHDAEQLQLRYLKLPRDFSALEPRQERPLT
jgi:hypothetical protein